MRASLSYPPHGPVTECKRSLGRWRALGWRDSSVKDNSGQCLESPYLAEPSALNVPAGGSQSSRETACPSPEPGPTYHTTSSTLPTILGVFIFGEKIFSRNEYLISLLEEGRLLSDLQRQYGCGVKISGFGLESQLGPLVIKISRPPLICLCNEADQ